MGTEALASGVLTRQHLRARYDKVDRNVWAPRGLKLTALDRAHAAWLWSQREATVVGLSAAAVLGSKWLPSDPPAELVRQGYHAPKGIVIRDDTIADDELCMIGAIRCTTAARTAYDIGRRQRGDEGIIRVDALLNATRCTIAEVTAVADRYPGARGVRQLRHTLDLADGGAESPKETELRLLLVRARRWPRPTTQIRVGRRRVDMGWPHWKVGVEYDGERHFTNAKDYADDIDRLEYLAAQGWTIVRVSARQLRFERADILRRVHRATAQYV